MASTVGDVRGTTNKELLNHFVSTALGTKKGKFLVTSWVLILGTSVTVGFLKSIRQRRWKRAERALKNHIEKSPSLQQLQTLNRELEEAAASSSSSSSELSVEEKRQEELKRRPIASRGLVDQLKFLLRIGFPSVFSRSTMHLVVYTILLGVRILLTIKIAEVTGKLAKCISSRSFTRMFNLQVVFGLWCLPAALVNSFLRFEQQQLALSLRRNLLRDAHKKYLADLVYYRASNLGKFRIEDIDQRICDDLKGFCTQVSEIYGNLLKPGLELIFLTRTLSAKMGGKYLSIFFLFFLITGQLLKFVMPSFAKITAETSRREGELRSNHHRLINYAEEIAFYGGAEREKEIVEQSFKSVSENLNYTYTLRFLMNMLNNYLVKYGASMVAYSMMMPAIYLGTQGMKGKSAPEIMQYYITSTQLFVALGTACKHLVLSYKRIQNLTGSTIRVSELFDMLGRRAGPNPETKEDIKEMYQLASSNPHRTLTISPPVVEIGSTIRFEHVDLFSPTGKLLVRDLNFEVKKNTNVLISGPNGSGKSSLFRVLGGLWPLCSGRLTKPDKDQLFYIPQQPYLAPGTLRDQVTYPKSFSSMTSEQEAHLNHLMELVDLSYLVERDASGWDVKQEWADVLSGGEKQRIAMARLFYHRPAFGILDECTSAVSVDVESKLYETCKRLSITIFTVSHRPKLRHHHDYELSFDGEGGWQWLRLLADGQAEVIHSPLHSSDPETL
eukprot:TRINITY_DN7348_c0_g1_i1.p1 TRINITY_DN7348_c0_g1~~TRINITY_DN7348_c0_g1_i1.p1  ORF type:complete len:727 (+),score=355.64 TRINITY_DN7348_c0_g1_i1:147-2327(+)